MPRCMSLKAKRERTTLIKIQSGIWNLMFNDRRNENVGAGDAFSVCWLHNWYGVRVTLAFFYTPSSSYL